MSFDDHAWNRDAFARRYNDLDAREREIARREYNITGPLPKQPVFNPSVYRPVIASTVDPMKFYRDFFTSFCTGVTTASPEAINRFRTAMLEASDILELSTADRSILRRRDAQGLCDWMRLKQKQTLQSLEDDDMDPLTGRNCSQIPLLFLIVIDKVCFDIISLWNHLSTDASKNNPVTGMPFTQEQVAYVRDRYRATRRVLQTVYDMVN